jgi:hypothetical protein
MYLEGFKKGRDDNDESLRVGRELKYLTAESVPDSIGSDFDREALVRVFNSCAQIARSRTGREAVGGDERELLALFKKDDFVGWSVDKNKELVNRLLHADDAVEMRESFLEQVLAVVLRRVSGENFDELPASDDALRAVLDHHPRGEALVHKIFAASPMPNNRSGIARIVGAVSPELQKELLASVFHSLVTDCDQFGPGMAESDGLALCALRFHDSVKLLQRVERLFDRDSRGYEAALQPLRVGVKSTLEALVVKDHGLIMIEVLKRTLEGPLSYEEQRSILVPIIELLGKNKLATFAITAFIAVPPVTEWLGSEHCHSELMPPPFYVSSPISQRAIEKAVDATIKQGEPSDFARALLKIMRYVSRMKRDLSPSLLGENQLRDVSDRVFSSGQFSSGQGALKLYCEMVNILSIQPKGCAVAMKSVFGILADETAPPIAVPFLLAEVRGALERYPNIVLSEAARSRNPSVAMDSVVKSLVSAGKGKDRRAKEILVRLFLLLDDGQGDTLFQGAPLSIDQQRQGASCLKSSLRASNGRLPERHE